MNKDFSELVEYLDKRFTNVDGRFDKIEKELEKKADKKDVQSLMNSIDKLVKAIETYHQEQIALSAKVDRHEKWIYQIAEKMGVELKP